MELRKELETLLDDYLSKMNKFNSRGKYTLLGDLIQTDNIRNEYLDKLVKLNEKTYHEGYSEVIKR